MTISHNDGWVIDTAAERTDIVQHAVINAVYTAQSLHNEVFRMNRWTRTTTHGAQRSIIVSVPGRNIHIEIWHNMSTDNNHATTDDIANNVTEIFWHAIEPPAFMLARVREWDNICGHVIHESSSNEFEDVVTVPMSDVDAHVFAITSAWLDHVCKGLRAENADKE